MGVPHIVLGLLAVFFAFDSQQNVTRSQPPTSPTGTESRTIPRPRSSPGPQAPPRSRRPCLPHRTRPRRPVGRFQSAVGPLPPLSATGARLETPFSWLWWWWYFDLEIRSGPRLSSIWARWTSQGGLVGAVSVALLGDYTRAFWLVLAIVVVGIAFAGIGYCLWCCTHALAMCCSPCRCCGRRARVRDDANHATLGTPEEALPIRGPHGLRPTDNDRLLRIHQKRGPQTRWATPRPCSCRSSRCSSGSTGGRRNPAG